VLSVSQLEMVVQIGRLTITFMIFSSIIQIIWVMRMMTLIIPMPIFIFLFPRRMKVKLEDQVCLLELAKKLKELGVKQDSVFYWVITMTTNYHLSYTGGDKSLLPLERNDFYSAFTVAELGEILLATAKDDEQLQILYDRMFTLRLNQKHETEADDRAWMLVYMIENGETDVEKLAETGVTAG